MEKKIDFTSNIDNMNIQNKVFFIQKQIINKNNIVINDNPTLKICLFQKEIDM